MVDTVYARPPTADRLVTTARAMLDEQGLDGLTLREIARRAEVSHGAPRRYFPTIALLLSAVAADGFRDLHAAVDGEVGALHAGADARERLAAAGRGYVRFAVANPGVFSVMFRPERCDRADADLATAGAAAFGQLAGLVAEAQAEGFHPDVDTTQLASIVWSTVHGLSVLWIDGGGSMPGAGPGAGLDHFVALSQTIVLGPDVARTTTPGGTTP
jgi:AcrR family transcriptional regulator